MRVDSWSHGRLLNRKNPRAKSETAQMDYIMNDRDTYMP